MTPSIPKYTVGVSGRQLVATQCIDKYKCEMYGFCYSPEESV